MFWNQTIECTDVKYFILDFGPVDYISDIVNSHFTEKCNELSTPCGFTYMTMMNLIIQQLYVNLNSCRLCQMSQTCN